MNSRAKGARGEREWAKLCRDHGFGEARRGQQYSGIEGEDVVGLPGIHSEVTRVERLNLATKIKQSKRDCPENKIPIVAHKRNHCPWLVTLEAEHFFTLLSAYNKED